MKFTVITATDTGAVVVIRGGITTPLIHAAALAWLPGRSEDDQGVTTTVRAALGPRTRARRYAIDRSGPVIKVWFTPYKRPEVVCYRGSPSGFVARHTLPAALQFSEVMQSDLPSTILVSTAPPPPPEFVHQP